MLLGRDNQRSWLSPKLTLLLRLSCCTQLHTRLICALTQRCETSSVPSQIGALSYLPTKAPHTAFKSLLALVLPFPCLFCERWQRFFISPAVARATHSVIQLTLSQPGSYLRRLCDPRSPSQALTLLDHLWSKAPLLPRGRLLGREPWSILRLHQTG